MRRERWTVFRRSMFAGVAVLTAVIALSGVARIAGQGSPQAVALTGTVSSQEEGPMEGVLVSAKRAGSTMTVTVVSDAQGRYSFPRTRLEPGSYAVRIRAVGYELEAPATASVAAQETRLDLKLRKTQDLAYQLSNGEWFTSVPGSVDMKNGLLNCTQCHSLEPIVRSRYTANEFPQILERMGRYAQGSTRVRPQLRPNTRGGGAAGPIMGEAATAGREGERPVQQ